VFDADNAWERKQLRKRVRYTESGKCWINLEHHRRDRRLCPDGIIESPEKNNVLFLEVDRSNKRRPTMRKDLDKYNRYFRYGFPNHYTDHKPVLVYVVKSERREQTLLEMWEKEGKNSYLPLAVFVGPDRAAAAIRAWILPRPPEMRIPPPDRADEGIALNAIRQWIVASARSMRECGCKVRGGPEVAKVKRALEVLEFMIRERP